MGTNTFDRVLCLTNIENTFYQLVCAVWLGGRGGGATAPAAVIGPFQRLLDLISITSGFQFQIEYDK